MTEEAKQNELSQDLSPGLSPELSNDDKLISLICHLSAAFGSIVLPAIVYFIYRKKSKFVSFNALQALYYQVAFFILTLVLSFLMTIILLMAGVDLASSLTKNLVILAFSLFFWGVELSYAAYIGVKTFRGEIILYFIFGELAYDRVYQDGYKESFNLSRKNKPQNTYTNTPPPNGGQNKGLI